MKITYNIIWTISSNSISNQLINFVQQKYGVLCFRSFYTLNNAAGHRADVRSSMAANVAFVADPTERHSASNKWAMKGKEGERSLPYLWKARPSVFAIDFATLVFPTPGGPTKHRIGPLSERRNWRTARYSKMRVFNTFRP